MGVGDAACAVYWWPAAGETAAEAARAVKSGTPSPGQRRTEAVTDEVNQDVREVNDQENEEDDTGCILM